MHLSPAEHVEDDSTGAQPPPEARDGRTAGPEGLLIPALAALVLRQARLSLIEGRMVAGIDRAHGSPVGLTPEDRKAMSLVSRVCLTHGLPDYGAEIHALLARCSEPLGTWLPIPSVRAAGLWDTALVHSDEAIPTAEAEEIGAGFGGVTAGLEEQVFAKLMELLGRFPAASANAHYTAIREFVVRHPVCTMHDIQQQTTEIPATLWVLLQQQFYEPAPLSWEINGAVPICDHCGNAMRRLSAGLRCRTNACSNAAGARTSSGRPAQGLLRASRGIRQYWVEPGIDEMRLYDALRAQGIAAELYPYRDRVDIAVGDVGIDLKTYASPETLGLRFKRSVGGLAYYPERFLVVPDWMAAAVPSYLDRVRAAMGCNDVEPMTLTEALQRLTQGAVHA